MSTGVVEISSQELVKKLSMEVCRESVLLLPLSYLSLLLWSVLQQRAKACDSTQPAGVHSHNIIAHSVDLQAREECQNEANFTQWMFCCSSLLTG